MASQQAVLLLLGALASIASGQEFLRSRKVMSTAAVRTELDNVLAEVLGHGHGVVNSRLSKIQRALDPLFRSLPKNQQGHVSAPVMRYAVRRYFSQNHGWIVKGFNAHEEVGNSSTAVDTDILQSKLPDYIRSILEDRFVHQGFSLEAVVAMVASVERLAFDQVVRGVELAFWLNSIDHAAALSDHDLLEILSSYMITEMLDGTQNKAKHAEVKAMIHKRYPHWDVTSLFLKDSVGSDIWERQAAENPFVHHAYSFDDAVRLAERFSEEFGSWSNHECHEMKDMLTDLDVHGTGRVRLADFYSVSKDGAWQFLEPSEQLRQSGALDESSTWLGPQVMIPNYINSMSNCITSAPYFSICCLNECDQVFQQLEARVAAPSASASKIISTLESGTYVPTNISAVLRDRLDEIARVNDGEIPIHSRLFARWLHFAYPQECPYPHAAGVVKPMTQQQWVQLMGIEFESASDEEIAQHIESDYALRNPSPDAGDTMWSLEEEHLESSTPSDVAPPAWSVWALLRIVFQFGMLGGFLSLFKPLVQMLQKEVKIQAMEYDV